MKGRIWLYGSRLLTLCEPCHNDPNIEASLIESYDRLEKLTLKYFHYCSFST
jgi:hypothetical protein